MLRQNYALKLYTVRKGLTYFTFFRAVERCTTDKLPNICC